MVTEKEVIESIKNISKDFITCLLVFISIYLWDVRLLSETKQISINNPLYFLNYIEMRWVYLLSFCLIYRSYFNYQKTKINLIYACFDALKRLMEVKLQKEN